MKNFAFFVPVLMLLGFMFVSTRLFASGSVSPTTLVVIMCAMFAASFLFRPKKNQKARPMSDVEAEIRGEFARDAFAEDPQLSAKFQSAIKDMASSMPKSAFNKLTKLAPLCQGDKERYAVAMALAQVQMTNGKFLDAARQYTTALVIHPSAEIAMKQGGCYQRMGELDRARSAYTYALDLDENNLEAHSAIATTYVADREYEKALGVALKILEKNETHASALATTAICYGLLDDPVMSRHFADRAEAQGYSRKKINDTISALKK